MPMISQNVPFAPSETVKLQNLSVKVRNCFRLRRNCFGFTSFSINILRSTNTLCQTSSQPQKPGTTPTAMQGINCCEVEVNIASKSVRLGARDLSKLNRRGRIRSLGCFAVSRVISGLSNLNGSKLILTVKGDVTPELNISAQKFCCVDEGVRQAGKCFQRK